MSLFYMGADEVLPSMPKLVKEEYSYTGKSALAGVVTCFAPARIQAYHKRLDVPPIMAVKVKVSI